MKRKELKIAKVFQADGKLFTTSLVIAKVFDKEHKHILEAIRNLKCSSEFNESNFRLVTYKDTKGESRPLYEIKRDGCMFLIMGFEGEVAAKWKECFIAEFNRMESELLRQHQPYVTRGYIQMTEAARTNWKGVRNELISTLNSVLNVRDRKRKSQFTDQMYLDTIEATAKQLREHFQLTQPRQLTRDYLHQLVQECVCEIEIRLTDALMTGTINSWPEFKDVLDIVATAARNMKELQNGRIPLPNYAFPQVNNMTTH